MRKSKFWILLLAVLFIFTACHPAQGSLVITNGSKYTMEVGESLQLQCKTENVSAEVTWSASNSCVEVSDSGLVTALCEGVTTVTAAAGTLSDCIEITVTAKASPRSIELSADKQDIFVGETLSLFAQYVSDNSDNDDLATFSYEIISGSQFATISGNILTGRSAGSVEVVATDGNLQSNTLAINISAVNEVIVLSSEKEEIAIGEEVKLTAQYLTDTPADTGVTEFEYVIISGNEYASLVNDTLTGLSVGSVTVIAKYNHLESNAVVITITDSTVVEKIELRADKYFIIPGETTQLHATVYPETANAKITYEVARYKYYTSLSGNVVRGLYDGSGTVFVAKIGGVVSNEITINVVQDGVAPTSIDLSVDKSVLALGDEATLAYTVTPSWAAQNIAFSIIEGQGNAEIIGDKVVPINTQPVTIVGQIGNVISNAVTINFNELMTDPYVNMTKNEFYSDYEPATSYMDSYYRTLHGFMSGDISAQDQAPTVSDYQPKVDGLFVRNSSAIYSEDGNTYYIFDVYGEVVNQVYKGGAYVTLEEVAAYVFAFGDIPANYTENKSGNPRTNKWGEYLRLNNSYFSGNTKQYPYEPLLPDIKGGGGKLYYYEIDIGTTGTDCDPKYAAEIYNDGYSITRGAARIVYTRYDANNNQFTDVNEKYLFYTYNHYNDFQEYLNYEGGWGEMFGNITGGGSISSKTDYNPTDYVPTVRKDFYSLNFNSIALFGF